MSDSVADLEDYEFTGGGGFDFADQVAEGVRKRIDETCDRGGRGFMVNLTEMMWLVAAYKRARANDQHDE